MEDKDINIVAQQVGCDSTTVRNVMKDLNTDYITMDELKRELAHRNLVDAANRFM